MKYIAVSLGVLTLLSAAPSSFAAEKTRAKPSAPAPKDPAAPAPASAPVATVVSYRDRDVVNVKTKLRYSSLIVLPPGERILDFISGDRELWQIEGNENLAYVKPAKAGATTNLNLITASGNIYSFLLTEVTERPEDQPDLKVFVEVDDESMAQAAGRKPRFVSSEQVDDYRQQVEIAKEEARQVKQSAQAAIDSGITKFIYNMRFPFRFEAGRKPFNVQAVYHDNKFTYIQARPEEPPTLYEIKDGKPNLVNFEYKNGVYVVDKVLDRGYLAIGNKKLAITSEE